MYETRHWHRMPIVRLHNGSTAACDCKFMFYSSDRLNDDVFETPEVVKLGYCARKY